MGEPLSVFGAGLVTDAWASVEAFARSPGGHADAGEIRNPFASAPPLEDAAIAQHDALAQLALRAVHEAYGSARLAEISGERVGLLFVSAWGTIDSTVAYLESMLEAEGRYASPRHFSRSVYSAIASIVAIHFQIHGPCETLSFPEEPVRAALFQARRLLKAGRAERVVVLWADQAAAVAQDLAARAVRQLGRKEYARFAPPAVLGQGAVAVVVGLQGGLLGGGPPATLELERLPAFNGGAVAGTGGGAFPMDGALRLVGWLLGKRPA